MKKENLDRQCILERQLSTANCAIPNGEKSQKPKETTKGENFAILLSLVMAKSCSISFLCRMTEHQVKNISVVRSRLCTGSWGQNGKGKKKKMEKEKKKDLWFLGKR